MSSLATVEQELKQYLEDSEHLTNQDKYKYLKAIFDKHFAIDEVNHVLTMNDFQYIVSNAKSNFQNITLPASISNRELYPSEVSNLLVVDAVLGYLNKFKVLKKLVKIDFTTKTNK